MKDFDECPEYKDREHRYDIRGSMTIFQYVTEIEWSCKCGDRWTEEMENNDDSSDGGLLR